ncbi:uncharacterized protein PV09_06446 [Verruconis gallopava]|uniref:Dolichyl-diphosphooligosaccharide-protein glycosyltransferase subunit OST5 n=1 Tax=Verruconis gallopava TaxID=253628 RepID=A0A0D2AT19_9PEZI|nr:uncharacterized protein PV09_06446 [Verruconis gallopava]KIW02299.1 hypothetical protein PV09_06446 [Verruconis gallopava]
MSSPDLLQVWEAAKANPFYPAVGKDTQFAVGFVLLLFSFLFCGAFALNRSLITLPLLGIPASLAFGFGTVYMICAVGVYV